MHKNETGLFEVEIDDLTYEFEKWGADESLDVLIDMAGIIGGPLGSALMQLFDKKKDEDKVLDKEINKDSLGVAFDALSKNLRKEIVKPIIKKFCSGDKVLCAGKKVKFDTHYQDRLGHMFKVAKAGMEVQYEELFIAARGATGKLAQARASIQALAM